jgi:hypothetical protein
MHVRFSLVLVDDQAPTLRRPLSPFSTSVLALQQQMASTIDQAVASTVGPNRFVVAISDTPHSWLAFQVTSYFSVSLCTFLCCERAGGCKLRFVQYDAVRSV